MDLYILSIFRCWDLHISFWQCSLLVYLDLLSLFYRLFLLYRCYETPLISVLLLSHRLLSPVFGPSSDVARKGKPFGALPVQRLLGSTLTFPFPFDYLSFHPTLACPRGQCCLALPSKDFPLFVELLTRKTYIKALPIGLEGHPIHHLLFGSLSLPRILRTRLVFHYRLASRSRLLRLLYHQATTTRSNTKHVLRSLASRFRNLSRALPSNSLSTPLASLGLARTRQSTFSITSVDVQYLPHGLGHFGLV
jgi:hypothetical protein